MLVWRVLKNTGVTWMMRPVLACLQLLVRPEHHCGHIQSAIHTQCCMITLHKNIKSHWTQCDATVQLYNLYAYQERSWIQIDHVSMMSDTPWDTTRVLPL